MDEDITRLDQLKHDPRNARKHSKRNIEMVTAALQEVGAARSIVIDEEGTVLAGNGVLEAAGEVGIDKVQVVEADGNTIIAVRRTGLSEEQKERLALLDNRAGELAEWDPKQLKLLMEQRPKALASMFTEEELAGLVGMRSGAAGKGEVDISPELLERHDYVLFIIDNELDWRAVVDEFGLHTMYGRDPAEVRSGTQSANKGIGRVLPVRELLRRLRPVDEEAGGEDADV
jgi:ParB-like chromosome segregation protein Spo0J